jgi:Fe-S-cluster containining protein
MRTCCQTSQVYVTLGDVRRIADHTGQEDFSEFRVPDDPIYVTSHADDPVWRQFVFRRDGTRRILRREADGSCVFLGPHGCTLPGDVRPLLCRLYPYDFNEREIYHTLARGCPLELLRPQESLTEALDMNLEMAEIWHRQLYEEIREEDPDNATASLSDSEPTLKHQRNPLSLVPIP